MVRRWSRVGRRASLVVAAVAGCGGELSGANGVTRADPGGDAAAPGEGTPDASRPREGPTPGDGAPPARADAALDGASPALAHDAPAPSDAHRPEGGRNADGAADGPEASSPCPLASALSCGFDPCPSAWNAALGEFSTCQFGTGATFLARCGPYSALVVQHPESATITYYAGSGEAVGRRSPGVNDEGLCVALDPAFAAWAAAPGTAAGACQPLTGRCAADGTVRPENLTRCADGPLWVDVTIYDRTCVQDADCVAVAEGDVCYPCIAACPSAAINARERPRYDADVARALVHEGGSASCGCYTPQTPCCSNGLCSLGRECLARR